MIPGFDGAVFSRAWGDALWGQVLHGCATTTEAIRRAIQHSQASLRQLARRYGINPKTARKIGYFHIDIAEVQTAEGKLYL